MRYRFLFPALFLFVLSITASAQDTVVVKKVTSATSITLASGETITLLGLGLPKSQAITAEDARAHLASLVEGSTVTLVVDSTAGSGKGRLVYLNGDLVNLAMISDGFATATAKPAHAKLAEFRAAESDAHARQTGAWATERSTAVQCSGTTQKGDRCKRMTTSFNGKCWQHQ
jgi:endonuclease YncB( thermonuclease family)